MKALCSAPQDSVCSQARPNGTHRRHTRHIGTAIAVFYIHLKKSLLKEKQLLLEDRSGKGRGFSLTFGVCKKPERSL
jgi:hypothetical protein